MNRNRNDLGKQLLVHQVSDPDKRACYQKGVDAMLDRIRREAWWMGLTHAFVLVLFMTQLLFAAGTLVYFTFRAADFQEGAFSFLVLALGWTLFFVAALGLLWHLNRRMQMSDVLVQVKGLEMRLLQLEEKRDGDAAN
jgi:hypothetical protein